MGLRKRVCYFLAVMLVLWMDEVGGQSDVSSPSTLSVSGSTTSGAGISTTPNPSSATDQETAEKYKSVLQRQDDCNPEGTAAAIRFLSVSNSDLVTKSAKELEDAGVPSDCAFRKTNLDKLRAFLNSKGFLTQPGSLVFVNAQDKRIKLDCKEEGRWKIRGSMDDEEWNGNGISGKRLDDDAPRDSLYFRIYTCHGTRAKCAHNFYVITRPQPKIDFPLQFSQGSSINVTCKMNPCFYSECHGKMPNAAPPYTFEWMMPRDLFDEGTKGEIECKNFDGTSDPKGPIYLKFEKGSSGNPVSKPSPKDSTTVTVSLSGKYEVEVEEGTSGNKTTKKVTSVVESTVSIAGGEDMHRGVYECIVIDGNGVPSIPSQGSVDRQGDRFTGSATLHVRNTIWLIIPLALILLMILIVLLLHFLTPNKMEDDDGNAYEKDEAVTPTDNNPPPNGAEGNVPPPQGQAPSSQGQASSAEGQPPSAQGQGQAPSAKGQVPAPTK